MLPLWTHIGILAVLFGVLGTVFDKYLLQKYFGDTDDSNAGPGALFIFSSYFAILFVIGIYTFGNSEISFAIGPGLLGVAAGICNGVWILLYLYAINRSDLSKVVPIFQIIPGFGLLLGFLFLGEVISYPQFFSMITIVLGALVLLYKKTNNFFLIDSTTLILMLLSSFFVAVSQLIFKIVSVNTNYVSASFWLWSGFVLFGMVLYLSVQEYQQQFKYMLSERIKSVTTANSFNEVFDNVTELLFFAAVMLGPMALVQALNAYEPVFILIVSLLVTLFIPKYFDEDVSGTSLAQKCIGISIITYGSFLLYGSL